MIENAIQNRLINFSALTALLNDANAVWAVLAPASQARPFITWSVFNDQPNEVMGQSTPPTECSFQVTIFADGNAFDSIPPITGQLKACLSRFSGTVDSVVIQSIFFDGYNDRFDREDNYYQRNHDFRAFYEE